MKYLKIAGIVSIMGSMGLNGVHGMELQEPSFEEKWEILGAS